MIYGSPCGVRKISYTTLSTVTLELTETVLMPDAENALETHYSLKALGVQLAVDDFGIGCSSFS
jgi:EAL domain-containing protein (putative c-di-GMP-specific phosphodiesterase class I)